MLSRWMNARQMRCWIVIVIVTITIMVTRTDLLTTKVLREGTSFTDLMLKLNNEKVAYNNRALVNSIQKYYLHHPSSLPYNISRPQRRNPTPGQSQFIDSYLKHMETFFTGKKPVLGKVVDGSNEIKNSRIEQYIHVQCFPLYTILLAIGRLEVDYFSLAVEGAERGVLDTIPREKVYIKTISIEYNKWFRGKHNLTRYMETKGYKLLTQIKVNVAPDLIFSRRKTNDFNDT